MCNYDKVENSYICWKSFLGKFCYFHRTQGIIWFSLKPESIGDLKQGSKAQRKQGLKTGAENRY